MVFIEAIFFLNSLAILIKSLLIFWSKIRRDLIKIANDLAISIIFFFSLFSPRDTGPVDFELEVQQKCWCLCVRNNTLV